MPVVSMNKFFLLDNFWLFFASLVVSLALVGYYRKLALRLGLVDEANVRSSHEGVTPRGAGVVIVALYSLGLYFFWDEIAGDLPSACLVLLPLALALVGLVDDYMALSSRVRLVLYLLLIAVVVAIVGEPFYFSGLEFLPSLLLPLIIAIGLLWLINLVNFMDGINGIVGFEALFFLGSAVILDASGILFVHPLILITSGAIIGFLYWNFPSAKVFMGDVGSIFLGALMGVYIVWSLYMGTGLFWSYMILLGVFFVDTTYTLLVRLCSGQHITHPHRSHAYQVLSRKWASHSRVVWSMLLLNFAWLLPLAWLARVSPMYGYAYCLLAYLPLLLICYFLKAGRAEVLEG